jgi:hypothetical protein
MPVILENWVDIQDVLLILLPIQCLIVDDQFKSAENNSANLSQ